MHQLGYDHERFSFKYQGLDQRLTGVLPAGLNVQTRDPALKARYLRETQQKKVRFVASNSFGFGGSNASLIFGAAR